LLTFCAATAHAATGDIVLYASDATNLHGNWTRVADATAAGGQKMSSADKGWSSPDNALASPADYFEVPFQANAGAKYHVWLRLRAAGDSKYNDSVFVQFSDAVTASGSALFRIGTTTGLDVNLQSCSGCALSSWGWLDGAYWLAQSSTVQFASSGAHTLRVQTREDGVQIDQIVLSPAAYLTASPGAVIADTTIIARPTASVASSTPFTGTAVALPGTIQAEDFDNGGEGIAFHDLTAGNTGGAYRSTNVDLESASEGGYDVGWISPGEWLAYSVNVSAAGSYLLEARVACAGAGGTFHIESGGTNLTGALTIPDTGGWQSWTTISRVVALSAGAQTLKVVFDTSGPAAVGNVSWFRVSSSASTPYSGTAIALPGSFAAANFDKGAEGAAYHDVSAGNSGGAYRSTDVDIESSSLGGYDVGWIDAGEWLSYAVNVAAAGDYTVQVQVASPGTSGKLHAQFGSVSSASVSVPYTGDWQAWSTVTLNVTLAAGPQTMKLVFDSGGFNVAGITIAAVPVVVVAAPPPPDPPAPPPPPASGNVIAVHAGGDLQGAINRAQPGDTLMLDAGATFTGNFVLPVKSGTDYVTIRSSAADSALPGATSRIDPSYAALLPKLKSPNSLPAIATDPGAHHYRLLALEFLPNPQGYYDMLDLGDGSSAQKTLASVPHDLIVDRVYMHGDPAIGQKRAIALNSASTTIQNSYISEIKSQGQDSQGIGGWNGPGPYTITNNYIEAAGENVLFGGADPAIPNLVPSNITIAGNYITKQLAWRTKDWSVKNGLELKNAAHVSITGNTIENSWVGGQMGALVLFTVRDQDGTAPWSTVADVVFANNVVRHGASFVSVLGYDDDPVARPSVRMSGLTISGNLIYDIDPKKWNDPFSGAWGLGRLIQILGGPKGMTIVHNTILAGSPNTSPTLNSALMIGQIGDTYKTEGLVVRDNVMAEGEYGVLGDTVGIGTVALDVYAPGWIFGGNLLVRGPSGGDYSYPATTVVTPAGSTVIDPVTLAVTAAFATTPTTDGKTVGADVAALKASIPGLDLTR
jgi:hypothetical protein